MINNASPDHVASTVLTKELPVENQVTSPLGPPPLTQGESAATSINATEHQIEDIKELTGGQEESPSFGILPIAKNHSLPGTSAIAFKKPNALGMKQMPSKYVSGGISQDMP